MPSLLSTWGHLLMAKCVPVSKCPVSHAWILSTEHEVSPNQLLRVGPGFSTWGGGNGVNVLNETSWHTVCFATEKFFVNKCLKRNFELLRLETFKWETSLKKKIPPTLYPDSSLFSSTSSFFAVHLSPCVDVCMYLFICLLSVSS